PPRAIRRRVPHVHGAYQAARARDLLSRKRMNATARPRHMLGSIGGSMTGSSLERKFGTRRRLVGAVLCVVAAFGALFSRGAGADGVACAGRWPRLAEREGFQPSRRLRA